MIENVGLMERVLADPDVLRESCRHPDWRVRYACAVAMGESRDAAWSPLLHELLLAENDRQLYSQPRVREFVGSYDDTRMAEQLITTEAVFDHEYPEELKEDWRCRGRVRQACLLAVHDIGSATPELVEEIHRILADPSEDTVVMAAGAKVLAKVGGRSSVPYLEQALEVDEWCLATELRKALRSIETPEL